MNRFFVILLICLLAGQQVQNVSALSTRARLQRKFARSALLQTGSEIFGAGSGDMFVESENFGSGAKLVEQAGVEPSESPTSGDGLLVEKFSRMRDDSSSGAGSDDFGESKSAGSDYQGQMLLEQGMG